MPASRTASRPAAARSVLRRVAATACVLALAPALSTAEAQTAVRMDGSQPSAQPASAADGPPPVRIIAGSVSLAVHPYTSCWISGNSGLCYDGIPPSPSPSLGGTGLPVKLAFARDRWHFRVHVEDQDGDRTRVDLVRAQPREWRLVLGRLPQGRYRADVFGRGPQGDVAAAFAFTLKLRQSRARLAAGMTVLGQHDEDSTPENNAMVNVPAEPGGTRPPATPAPSAPYSVEQLNAAKEQLLTASRAGEVPQISFVRSQSDLSGLVVAVPLDTVHWYGTSRLEQLFTQLVDVQTKIDVAELPSNGLPVQPTVATPSD